MSLLAKLPKFAAMVEDYDLRPLGSFVASFSVPTSRDHLPQGTLAALAAATIWHDLNRDVEARKKTAQALVNFYGRNHLGLTVAATYGGSGTASARLIEMRDAGDELASTLCDLIKSTTSYESGGPAHADDAAHALSQLTPSPLITAIVVQAYINDQRSQEAVSLAEEANESFGASFLIERWRSYALANINRDQEAFDCIKALCSANGFNEPSIRTRATMMTAMNNSFNDVAKFRRSAINDYRHLEEVGHGMSCDSWVRYGQCLSKEVNAHAGLEKMRLGINCSVVSCRRRNTKIFCQNIYDSKDLHELANLATARDALAQVSDHSAKDKDYWLIRGRILKLLGDDYATSCLRMASELSRAEELSKAPVSKLFDVLAFGLKSAQRKGD